MKYIDKSYFKKQPTAYESATEAIKHISSWTNWMSGLATAALAAILVILKDFGTPDACSKCYAYLAALCLVHCKLNKYIFLFCSLPIGEG